MLSGILKKMFLSIENVQLVIANHKSLKISNLSEQHLENDSDNKMTLENINQNNR